MRTASQDRTDPENDITPSGCARRGFTLLELLMVVGILGILVAATVPRIAAVLARRSVSGATGGFEALVRRARATAIQTRLPATITFASGVATVTVVRSGTLQVIGQPLDLSSQYGVAVTPSSNALRIEPTGLILDGLPFTVISAKGDAADTARITGFGRIQ